MRFQKISQRGMTMLELSVVLLVLIALAGLAVPYVGGKGRTAMCQTTDATMQAVKEAIMGGAAGIGFYGDNLGAFPAVEKNGNSYSLHFLFTPKDVDAAADAWPLFNPKTAVGWRGPYLMNGASLDTSVLSMLDASFGTLFDPAQPATTAYVHINLLAYDGADADTNATDTEAAKLVHVLDAWRRPIILQVPYYDDDGPGAHIASYHPEYARLVSAGPGSGLEPGGTTINTPVQSLDAHERLDDRVLYLQRSDPWPQGNTPCDQS